MPAMKPLDSTSKEPHEVQVKEGRTYLWCGCGFSNRQPFCDSSHGGSGRTPLRWRSPETGTAYFCGCKLTKTPPLCDGSHNDLEV